MNKRSTVLLMFAAAVVSAAITAAAFMLTGGEQRQSATMPADAAAASTIALNAPASIQQVASDAPVVGPASEAEELTRSSVNWTAVYDQTIPSLVSIRTESGGGSGFFVSVEGHIITNLHVVAGALELVVYTHTNDTFEAELIAKDVGNDLALLKIEPEGMTIALPEFGDLSDLRVGDPVGALGAPFGLPDTLTVGIVSGLGRTRPSGTATWEPLRGTIQTDAALNPGNSGGMLVDGRGRLIGIPTQIQSPDQSSAGIGFAVSVETLSRSLPIMIEGRDVQRGYLGLFVEQRDGGLFVIDVICQSTANQAGLREGDHITLLNGHTVESLSALTEALKQILPGERVEITLERDGKTLKRSATAGSWPSTRPENGCG